MISKNTAVKIIALSLLSCLLFSILAVDIVNASETSNSISCSSDNPTISAHSKKSSSGGSSICPAGKCYVNGYTTKKGTKVKGYCRRC